MAISVQSRRRWRALVTAWSFCGCHAATDLGADRPVQPPVDSGSDGNPDAADGYGGTNFVDARAREDVSEPQDTTGVADPGTRALDTPDTPDLHEATDLPPGDAIAEEVTDAVANDTAAGDTGDAADGAADDVPEDVANDSAGLDAPDVAQETVGDDVADPSCDDANACTEDTFADGACQHSPMLCGDADICTEDFCDPVGDCLHVEVAEACQNSACGPCPTYAGFECVHQGDAWTCENGVTDEVFVAAGTYWRGCNPSLGADQCDKSSKPQHKVYESDFSIDRTEVTHAAFTACGPKHGCSTNQDYAKYMAKDTPSMPIRWLNLSEATAYCTWAGKRICWDAEWEKAARGGCEKQGCADDDDNCCKAAMPTYPWGFDLPACPETAACDAKGPSEVGTHSVDRSPYGAMDMAANVSEWCRDGFEEYSDLLPSDGGMLVDPKFDGGDEWDTARTTRAAGFYDGDPASPKSMANLRTDRRGLRPADAPDGTIGFRCCRSFP